VMVVLDVGPVDNLCHALVDFVKGFGPKMCAGFSGIGRGVVASPNGFF